MLTIKHIESDGHEGLLSATDVSYRPNTSEGPQVVAFGAPGSDAGARKDGVVHYGDGIVYVMNDNGKTVARYNLD